MCSGISISTRVSSSRSIRNETRFQYAAKANSLQLNSQCILRCHCTMSVCPGEKRKSTVFSHSKLNNHSISYPHISPEPPSSIAIYRINTTFVYAENQVALQSLCSFSFLTLSPSPEATGILTLTNELLNITPLTNVNLRLICSVVLEFNGVIFLLQ